MCIPHTCISASSNPLVPSRNRASEWTSRKSTFAYIIHIHVIKNQSSPKEIPYVPVKWKAALGQEHHLTVVAVVIDEDNLLQQVGGCPTDDGMNGSQDDRQRFVHEDEDDADLRQTGGVRDVSATGGESSTQSHIIEKIRNVARDSYWSVWCKKRSY